MGFAPNQGCGVVAGLFRMSVITWPSALKATVKQRAKNTSLFLAARVENSILRRNKIAGVKIV